MQKRTALLSSYRRFWALLIVGVLCVPMAAQSLLPARQGAGEEARTLAPPPDLPRTPADGLKWPRQVDAYLGDHFGFRLTLAAANGAIRYALHSPSGEVLMGRDRWLFFRGDGMIEQSMGLLQRRIDLGHFLDTMADLHARYAARGIAFAVVVPPNATSVMSDRTPAWLTPGEAPTEYDAMLQGLRRRQVPTADLRRILRDANREQPVYLSTDTHWNRLGALLAFNATVPLIGRPDWVVDPARVTRGFSNTQGGDLARMMGIGRLVRDRDVTIDLAAYAAAPYRAHPIETGRWASANLTETDRSGPSLVIVGDSFTEHAWRDYFALHVRRLVWVHQEFCNFDRALVEAQKPDIIIYAPTERFMFCWNTVTPAKGQIQPAPAGFP